MQVGNRADAIIKLEKVCKSFRYPEALEVIDNLNLEARDGEFVCILGPSGCGKSVLLWMVAGFEKPTVGRILFFDEIVLRPSPARMMIFQEYALFPWKTVLMNVVTGMAALNAPKKEKRARALAYLEKMGLLHFRDWYPHKLSGGMKQRVAIARALCVDSRALLMDEPFAALDSQHRSIMQEELVRIWQETKKTILFVTHSINEAVYLADRIYLLTARPATVKEAIDVDLPRPRNRTDATFIAVVKETTQLIREEVEKAYEEEMTKGISSLL